MEQELVDLISALGSAGERAFYVYLFVHYGSNLTMFLVSSVMVFFGARYMLTHM